MPPTHRDHTAMKTRGKRSNSGLTPGGVDQDLVRLGHSRIDRPMIPFDAEIPAPSAAGIRRGGGETRV